MLDLAVASAERHERFIRRAIAAGEVWVLQRVEAPHSWATSSCEFEDEETGAVEVVPIVPFWSDRAYAARCAKGPWSVYAPRAIALDDFVDQVLQDMHRKGALAGTNWNGDLVGRDIEPIDLARELSEAMDAAERAPP